MTIREALRSAVERLELHHVSNARLTAELVLAHVLSVEREHLYAHDDRVLNEQELQMLEDRLYDRISGVPLQYIVGRQEFYGRYFRVNPSVLIPRPETEYIIEAVLDIQGTRGLPPRPLSMIDVGTGSGCIAVTLALELRGTQVFAADVSFEALLVARENAATLGAPVRFVCMDVLDAIQTRFDFIVSNPPYVRRSELSRLQREVREHEPHVALFSPEDELAIYRRLIVGAEEMLKSGGHVIMEVGIGMDERVLSLFGPRWDALPTKTDLQGIPRTVIAMLR
ncbi:MAG TPA: peptide chain release factor N(5)-glutamine methyltransferase [Terriglobia bacterium]|nr:peptide chain release factor N(5)-glutamine methyltransferase [Terriglobia bacterium]